MIYLLIYLIMGMVAFWWVVRNEKEPLGDDAVLLMYVMANPLAWFVCLLWPLLLPVYHIEIREGARLRRERKAKFESKTIGSISDMTGKYAKVFTSLRPTGLIEIEGQQLEAHSEGGFVDAGESVVVIRQHGSDIMVRKEMSQHGANSQGVTRRP